MLSKCQGCAGEGEAAPCQPPAPAASTHWDCCFTYGNARRLLIISDILCLVCEFKARAPAFPSSPPSLAASVGWHFWGWFSKLGILDAPRISAHVELGSKQNYCLNFLYFFLISAQPAPCPAKPGQVQLCPPLPCRERMQSISRTAAFSHHARR